MIFGLESIIVELLFVLLIKKRAIINSLSAMSSSPMVFEFVIGAVVLGILILFVAYMVHIRHKKVAVVVAAAVAAERPFRNNR